MSIVHFGGELVPQLFNSDGTVALSGRVDFLVNKTSTPKNVFTDSGLGTSAGNSINLDAGGRIDVWLNDSYRVRLFNSVGVLEWELDDVNLPAAIQISQSNLAPNSSFEVDSNGDGVPDGWVRTVETGATVERITTDNQHGAWAMNFISVGNGGGTIESEAFIAITPLADTELSFLFINSVANFRDLVQLLWFKGDQAASATPSTDIYDESAANPTSWTKKTFTVGAPSDARFVKIKIFGAHPSDATPGNVSFDDVVITQTVAVSQTSMLLENLALAASVASDALTIDLKTKLLVDPGLVTIAFRNATLATGDFVLREVTAALGITIPATATLGFLVSEENFIYIYALDNAGTVELAVAKQKLFDEALVHTTTILNTSSDANDVLYSTTARTGVAIRLIGRLKIQADATPGLWDTAPTELAVFSPHWFRTGLDPLVNVHVHQASNQAVATGDQDLTLDVVDWDTQAPAWNTAADEYTVPFDGIYKFFLALQWSLIDLASLTSIHFAKNGDTVAPYEVTQATIIDGSETVFATAYLDLVKGDTIKIRINRGGSSVGTTQSATDRTWAIVERVGNRVP